MALLSEVYIAQTPRLVVSNPARAINARPRLFYIRLLNADGRLQI